MVSLDIESIGPRLRGIRISRLSPELLDGVLELAADQGYELTFASSSDLDFLFRIYQAEKVKGRRGAKALKRAEKLILAINGLYFNKEGGTERAEHKKEKKRPRFDIMESELAISRRMHNLFESVGITDEREMQQSIALLGEKKVEERIAEALRSKIGPELIRKVLSENPEVLRIVKDGDFSAELSAMENKKGMIDAWKGSHGKVLPVWADYDQSPNILLVEYKNIYRALGMEGWEGISAGPEKGEHLMKMLKELGLIVQERGGALVIKGPEGKALTIPAREAGADPYAVALKKIGAWHVGMEEDSQGEMVSTGKMLRMIEGVITSNARMGIESDIIVVTGDKRKLNQLNQLFGREVGDQALAAYRKIFESAVLEAAGRGTPFYIRPSMSGDEAIGVIVASKGKGEEVRARLADCLERATGRVLEEVGRKGHPLGEAMRKLRRPRDAVEALVDISEPVLVRRDRETGNMTAEWPDGSDAMISRPDGSREFLAAQVRTTDEQGSARHAPSLRSLLNTPTSPQIESRTGEVGPDELVSGVAFELKVRVADEAVLKEMQELLPRTGKGLYEVERNSFGIRGMNTFLGHYGANGLIQRIEDAVAEYAAGNGLGIRRVGTLKYVIEGGTAAQAEGLRESVGRQLAAQGMGFEAIASPKSVSLKTSGQIEGAIANGHLGLDWESRDYANANAAISAMALANDEALGRAFGGAEIPEVTSFIRAHPEVRNVLDLFTAFRSPRISGNRGPAMEEAFSGFVMSLRGARTLEF